MIIYRNLYINSDAYDPTYLSSRVPRSKSTNNLNFELISSPKQNQNTNDLQQEHNKKLLSATSSFLMESIDIS